MDINNIKKLLGSRLIDMSGDDIVYLLRYSMSESVIQTPAPVQQAIGINALAVALSCSPSQISKMRKSGVLRNAIISHVGRNYVFDIDKARQAAISWRNGGSADDSVPATV